MRLSGQDIAWGFESPGYTLSIVNAVTGERPFLIVIVTTPTW